MGEWNLLMVEYVADRDDALRSLDLAKINTYLVKYGTRPMPDTVSAWGGIHKARTALASFSDEERALSKRWLADHGMTAWD